MFVAPICTMGGAIAANMAAVRRTRESNETPRLAVTRASGVRTARSATAKSAAPAKVDGSCAE